MWEKQSLGGGEWEGIPVVPEAGSLNSPWAPNVWLAWKVHDE